MPFTYQKIGPDGKSHAVTVNAAKVPGPQQPAKTGGDMVKQVVDTAAQKPRTKAQTESINAHTRAEKEPVPRGSKRETPRTDKTPSDAPKAKPNPGKPNALNSPIEKARSLLGKRQYSK
jgi:hypothetical protein